MNGLASTFMTFLLVRRLFGLSRFKVRRVIYPNRHGQTGLCFPWIMAPCITPCLTAILSERMFRPGKSVSDGRRTKGLLLELTSTTRAYWQLAGAMAS